MIGLVFKIIMGTLVSISVYAGAFMYMWNEIVCNVVIMCNQIRIVDCVIIAIAYLLLTGKLKDGVSADWGYLKTKIKRRRRRNGRTK